MKNITAAHSELNHPHRPQNFTFFTPAGSSSTTPTRHYAHTPIRCNSPAPCARATVTQPSTTINYTSLLRHTCYKCYNRAFLPSPTLPPPLLQVSSVQVFKLPTAQHPRAKRNSPRTTPPAQSAQYP